MKENIKVASLARRKDKTEEDKRKIKKIGEESNV